MFSYNDVNVNYTYIDNKSKMTLIFLHGWGQNIQMMEPIAKPFRKRFNILIVDLPGHGRSSEPTYAWELNDFVELIHKLVAHLKIKSICLIGHSFGGKISILYASKYNVDKLVLLSSPYKVQIKKVSLKLKVLKFFARVPFLKPLSEFVKKHIGSTDYKNASPIMRDILVKHVNTDATDECKKIKVPTIIIWGTEDKTVDISEAYEINKLINDSAVVEYEGLTHFAYLEDLNRTVGIIDALIK